MEDTQIKRFFIGDRETCGLGEDNVACQIGLIEIDPVTLDVIFETEALINPQRPIHPRAAEIHGITDEMVADKPTLAEYIEQVLGYQTGSITMCAHNIPFDIAELSLIGGVDRTICSLAEARHFIPKGGRITPGPKSHKLADLAEYFGFVPDTAHRALADCHTTRLLLKKLVEVSGRTLEQMAAVKQRTVIRMPWGKHANQLLLDLPTSYLSWLSSLPDLETNLRESVTKVLSLR